MQIVKYAMKYVGIQYKKKTPRIKLDCSSFTQMVFGKFEISLPRTTIEQSKLGVDVDIEDLQIGDLLFFYVPEKHPTNDIVGHVGIYAGKRKMVHCIPTSNVFLTDINKPHWKKTFLFARRIMS